jgi:hypothetical protein
LKHYETLQGDDSSFSLSDDDTKHLFNKTDDLKYEDTSSLQTVQMGAATDMHT